MTKRLATALVTGAAVIAVVGAPIAGATPTGTQYDNKTASISKEQPKVTVKAKVKAVSKPKVKAVSKPVSVAGKVSSKPAPAPTAAKVTSNDLPFTGLNTGFVLLFGGIAVVSGLLLRGIAARRRQ